MIKRTIEVSSPRAHLSVKDRQLVVSVDYEQEGRAPLEDIGVLILDSVSLTCTQAALASVAENEGVVVVCGKNHAPAGLLWPMAANTVLAERIALQARVKEPQKKQLWRRIVQAKIRNQGAALPQDAPVRERLAEMARKVRSGDPENLEAQAAKIYWSELFAGQDFRRSRDGPPPNNLLNYGYMAIRAACVRAICAAGLHPALGLHHKNRYNPFCLADDLMEPYRPLVDMRVRQLVDQGVRELDREGKRQLLALLVAFQKTAFSLVRCFQGEAKNLELPKL